MKIFFRFLPIIIVIILMIIIISIGGFKFFTFENLKNQHILMQDYLKNHSILFPLIFIAAYIIATALSIPGAVFLTILGGYLFGKYIGTIYVAIGATLGASILFLAAKTAIKDFFIKKAGPLMNKIGIGFKKNAHCYMLFLRFIPLFPFWLVNIVPAIFNIRYTTFLWTTFIGILPGTFVFAQAGVGLKSILEQETFSLKSIFTFEVNLTLILLAIFALIPVVFKKIKNKIC